jgi:hypothetical protein
MYNNLHLNKKLKAMPRVYLTKDMMSKMTYSGLCIYNYILAELKVGKDYKESQRLEIIQNELVKDKIISKNKFYQGIKELLDLEIIYKDTSTSKHTYLVSYYYILNMTDLQYKDFKNEMLHTNQVEYAESQAEVH